MREPIRVEHLRLRPYSQTLTRLKRRVGEGHSSLFGPLVSYEDTFCETAPGEVFATLHFLRSARILQIS
jgi:hypothetical protein